MLLAAQNRLLTADFLTKRGWHGPSICVLCRKEAETLDHLFFLCQYAKSLWNQLLRLPLMTRQLTSGTSGVLPEHWSRTRNAFSGSFKNDFDLIFIASCWALWNERNKRLFEDRLNQSEFLGQSILCTVRLWKMSLGEG
uniref:Reverse transcriptase zinc-binding domain-containing protein n=1 Tax=Ananas comosus var. bracteatus TaxID=296719 RepID=A0A6V7P8Q1_ANACO|nr:unnamed protein product [Ananas comosus var. bracteatus]